METELQPLSKEEIKTLESMLIVSAHEMNVILNAIELGLFRIYKESKDYKKLVKMYGKTNADEIVKATTHQQLTQDETYQIGKILQKIGELKYLFDRLTGAGTAITPGTKDKEMKEMEMFEALMNDANLFAWRHAMMCNIPAEDDIKLDSTLKLLAKDHRVSDNIIARFVRK